MSEYILNELGNLLKNKLNRKREQILNFHNRELYGKCIEIEGEIAGIEDVWYELMQRGLLTEKINV